MAINEESLVGGSEVGEEEALVVGNLGLKGITGDLSGGWAGLLENVLNDAVLSSSALVVEWDTLPVKL